MYVYNSSELVSLYSYNFIHFRDYNADDSTRTKFVSLGK